MSENRESKNLVKSQEAAPERVHPMARAAPERVHPMVRAALSAGSTSPETIRELLAVQREWEAEEARKAFTRDLAAAKGELPAVIGTDAQNDRLRAKYTTLAKLLDIITAPLAKYGFSIGGTVGYVNERILVTTTLTHRQGHCESITLPGRPETIKTREGKSVLTNEQALGKTITYLRRYGVATLLGLASGDMPDTDDQPAPDKIDTARNQRAVTALADAGLDLKEAEAKIQRPWKQWTAGDLQTLADWMNPEPRGDK